MEVKNKTFLVYGLGISGKSAYKFLKNMGANVFIYADKQEVDGEFEIIKNFNDALKLKPDYVVLSPGVNIIGNKNIAKLKKAKIKLISELELGYLFCKGKFIAVTGTNGKTTCVTLLNHILSKKYKTFSCGNVGVPITSICKDTDDNSVVICEVSSFMLELISPNFSPDVACILNITPDHLSRHKTFDEYVKCKLNITNYQTNNQILVLNKSLDYITTNANKIFIDDIRFNSKLIGGFNQENINFCFKICEILGVSKKEFMRSLKTFQPVQFRLQTLGKKKGITYINDSKSTNVNSCVQALNSMNKKVVLLLGGSDKGDTFEDIFKQKDKIKIALIYGQTANQIENSANFMRFSSFVKFNSLKDVLYNLNNFVKRGDIVLLSPACASYDEFDNYCERGKTFNEYFNQI